MKYNILKFVGASLLMFAPGETQALRLTKPRNHNQEYGDDSGGRVVLKVEAPKLDIAKDESEESKSFDKLFGDEYKRDVSEATKAQKAADAAKAANEAAVRAKMKAGSDEAWVTNMPTKY